MDDAGKHSVDLRAGDHVSRCFAVCGDRVDGGPLPYAKDISSDLFETHGDCWSHCPFRNSLDDWLDRSPNLVGYLFDLVSRPIIDRDCRSNIRTPHTRFLGLPSRFKGNGASNRSIKQDGEVT